MKKVGLICKDAGCGFYLSQMCKKDKKKYVYFLSQPALGIFKKELGKFKNNTSTTQINKINKIIIGTGKTNYEKYFLNKLIKKKNIVVFVDHWMNFKKRFIYKKKFLKPNEVWVSDKKTYQLSKNYFPKITKFINFDLIKMIKKKKNNNFNFLYLMGSLNQSKFDNNLTKKIKMIEKKSFENFIFFLKKNDLNKKKIKIKVRIHTKKKNKNFIKKRLSKFKNIKFSNQSLIDDINSATYVFGANSSSMFIAEKLRKKLIICLDQRKQIFNTYKSFKLIKIFKLNEN